MATKFISEEYINKIKKKSAIYHLDMLDVSLSYLVEEFLEIGHVLDASLLASMRFHMIYCAKVLGIEPEDRSINFETIRKEASEQQNKCMEIIGNILKKEKDE